MPIQLDDILMDALALNRPRWKDIPQLRGITYEVETHLAHPETVLGNASELRRVLSNLLINAIDAMPQGGLLTFVSRQCGERVASPSATLVSVYRPRTSNGFLSLFSVPRRAVGWG